MWNKLPVTAATILIKAMSYGDYSHFQKSLDQPEHIQSELLKKLVRDLARTEYGKHYGIDGREDYFSFASKLPIHTYEEMEPWITKHLETQQPIITPHRIVHSEPTSGSSGRIKYIPYTKPLLRSFSNMFRIWAYDLLRHRLKLETGRIFISISPSTDRGGFTDDRGYIGGILRGIFSLSLVLPPKSDSTNFLHTLALTLLEEEKLEVISIWSPSYLLVLLEYIHTHRDMLVDGLSHSQRSALFFNPVDWKGVWPHLKMISCWDNALAESLSGQLQKIFPHVWIQGKGLLATEAPITIPLTNSAECLPLIQEIFLEFEASNGEIKRVHELQEGERYQLIITQKAGLIRYRLGDIVETGKFHRNTPSLIFIGRANQVCDMAGEKLNEIFVRHALSPLLPEARFILVPYSAHGQGYILLTESTPEELAERADTALCQAYHYALARHQGQIMPLQVRHIPDLLLQVRAFYRCDGMKIGDIKDTVLLTDPVQGEKLLACLNGSQDKTEQLLPMVAV